MSIAGGIPEWHRQEERRLTHEWIATQRAAAEWEARKARRRAKVRRCAHWCNPLVQVVSDVGRDR